MSKKRGLGVSDLLPSRRYPMTPGVEAGDFVFLMGQAGFLEKGDRLEIAHRGDVRAQTKETLDRMEKTLEEVGLDMSSLVSATLFLKDIEDYFVVNDVYYDYVGKNAPARIACQVTEFAIPGELVKIGAIATKA